MWQETDQTGCLLEEEKELSLEELEALFKPEGASEPREETQGLQVSPTVSAVVTDPAQPADIVPQFSEATYVQTAITLDYTNPMRLSRPHEALQGETALTWSVKNKDPNLLKQLLDAGADRRVCNRQLQTPLLIVCAQGDLELAILLLHNMAPLSSDQVIRHLAWASSSGNVALLGFLYTALGAHKFEKEMLHRCALAGIKAGIVHFPVFEFWDAKINKLPAFGNLNKQRLNFADERAQAVSAGHSLTEQELKNCLGIAAAKGSSAVFTELFSRLKHGINKQDPFWKALYLLIISSGEFDPIGFSTATQNNMRSLCDYHDLDVEPIEVWKAVIRSKNTRMLELQYARYSLKSPGGGIVLTNQQKKALLTEVAKTGDDKVYLWVKTYLCEGTFNGIFSEESQDFKMLILACIEGGNTDLFHAFLKEFFQSVENTTSVLDTLSLSQSELYQALESALAKGHTKTLDMILTRQYPFLPMLNCPEKLLKAVFLTGNIQFIRHFMRHFDEMSLKFKSDECCRAFLYSMQKNPEVKLELLQWLVNKYEVNTDVVFCYQNHSSSQDTTLLIAAVALGDVEVVECLLDLGAKPNFGVNGFSIPLAESTKHHHFLIAQILLERGADPDAQLDVKDASGAVVRTLSIREFALEQGAHDIYALLEEVCQQQWEKLAMISEMTDVSATNGAKDSVEEDEGARVLRLSSWVDTEGSPLFSPDAPATREDKDSESDFSSSPSVKKARFE